MAQILVSGYYGFGNAGDEAILSGLITAIRELEPTVRFTVISGKAVRTREVHGVEAVSRGDYKNIWRAMARTNLLISGGGSLLQDVTGIKSIPYYLGVVSMAKLRGVPVMFYAQGVGPVTRVIGKSLIPLVGNLVNQITVRDQESAVAMRALGVSRPPLQVTADAALALGPVDPAKVASLLDQVGVDRSRGPLIGVAIRPWRFAHGEMEAALAQGLDSLVREIGAQVLFIPMQQPQDVLAARVVAAMMSSQSVIAQGDFNHREVQAMVGSCDLLIGMRYHALVFAAMARVPLVGLSYDPKNDSFLRLLGQEAVGTAYQLDPGLLSAAVQAALTQSSELGTHYGKVIAGLTPLSRQNAQIALKLMQQRRRS